VTVAEELPPAVARFIADVSAYTEPLQRAIKDTEKLKDRTDAAAIKARQLGLAAREGADRAAAAMRHAEEAAARFERGEISLAEATKAATNAAQAQARADMQLVAAEAAVTAALKANEEEQKKFSKSAEKASGAGFSEMSMLKKIWMIAGYATGALEPLAAAILAVAGGLSSGLVSAVMGVGIFGIVAKSVFTSSVAGATAAKAAQDRYTASVAKAEQTYKNSMSTATTAAARQNAKLAEQKALTTAVQTRTTALAAANKGLSASQVKLGKDILGVKDQWHQFIAAVAPGVAHVIDSGLALVPRFLQYMGMFLPPVEDGLMKVIKLISAGTNTTWFIAFMQAMSANSGQSIVKIAVAIGHLIKGIAGLLTAFAPFSQVVLSGLDKMTAKFAAWGQGLGQTKGFADMMTMVKTQGPTIVTIIRNLAIVFGQFAKDMAGSASNMVWLKFLPQLTGLAATFMKANPGLIMFVMNIMLVTSTMKSGIGVIGKFTSNIVDLGKGAVKAGKNTASLIRGFNDAEAAASAATGKWGTVGGKLKSIFSGVPIKNFTAGFKSADAAASETTGKMGSLGGKISAMFSAIQAASMAPVKGLSNFSKGFKDAEYAAAGASGMMGTFGGNVKGLFTTMKSGGQSAFSAISTGVSTAVTAVAALPAVLSAAVAAVKSWAIWSKVAAAATKIWTIIQAAFDVVMAANPIVLIIIGIMALVGVIIYCYTHFKIFRDVVHTVFEFIKTHWPLILAILTGPIGLAVYFIIKYWNTIYGFFKGIIVTIINFVKAHWQLILGILGGPLGMAVFLITKYWNTIYGFFKSIIMDVINFVKSHWQLLLGILGGPLGMAVYLITKYWKQIYHVFLMGVNWVLGALGSLLSKTVRMFAGVGTMLFNAGKWLVQGFINGIESMFNMVVATARNLISNFGGTILKVLGLGSPSKVAMYWGKMTGHGMALGLLGQVSNVRNAAQRMALAANTGMSTIGMRNVLPGGILRTGAATGGLGGGGGPLNVFVDGKKLFEIMQSRTYKYNIRNSGAVTGILRPV
jgi:exonuclease VII small subunit